MTCIPIFLLAVCAATALAAVPSTERAALVDFYHSTGGQDWVAQENWLQNDPCEQQWQCVTCNADNTHVVKFFPSCTGENIMIGTLPNSIGNLDQLQELYMSNGKGGKLTGTLPSSLGLLTQVKCLYLSHNGFVGPIPESFGKLHSVMGLELRGNQLTGRIPAALGNLTILERLIIDDNQLVGDLAALVPLAPRLQRFRAAINQLSGTYPPELCGLPLGCWAGFNERLTLADECCKNAPRCLRDTCDDVPVPWRQGPWPCARF